MLLNLALPYFHYIQFSMDTEGVVFKMILFKIISLDF